MVGAGQGPGGSSKRAFDPDIVDVAMAAAAAAAAAAARVVQAHVVKQAPSQPVSQSVSLGLHFLRRRLLRRLERWRFG